MIEKHKKIYQKHGFCIFRKVGKNWVPVEGVADSVETILRLDCSQNQVSLWKKDYVGYYIDCDDFNKNIGETNENNSNGKKSSSNER